MTNENSRIIHLVLSPDVSPLAFVSLASSEIDSDLLDHDSPTSAPTCAVEPCRRAEPNVALLLCNAVLLKGLFVDCRIPSVRYVSEAVVLLFDVVYAPPGSNARAPLDVAKA